MSNLITLDTGLKEFDLNGAVTVMFNPGDIAFLQRLYEAFERIQAIEAEKQSKATGITEPAELWKVSAEYDEKIRADINQLFDKDVCTPVFGSMSISAVADGLPLWCNLIMAIIDLMDTNIQQETKAQKARIDKYVKKYHR